MTEDLLKPSLRETQNRSILSTGPFIAGAFFGGPTAVLILAFINSSTLDRVGRDWPILAIGFLGSIAAVVAFATYLFDGISDPRSVRYSIRAAGFVMVLVVYLLHKHELRAVASIGTPRSPWVPVIGSIAVAILIHFFVISAIAGTPR